jgi:hypothetical protein
MKHRLAVAALVLALAGCGSPSPSATLPAQSPTGTPPTAQIDAGGGYTGEPSATAEPTPKQAQVGAPITVTSGDKVSKVTIVSAKYSPEPIGGYSTPEKGGYLILDVLWESEKGTADVSPYLFNAKDATGVQKGTTYVSGLDLLASAHVPPGDKLRGAVVFDIAGGPWIVTLGTFTEIARWTITP